MKRDNDALMHYYEGLYPKARNIANINNRRINSDYLKI